MADRRPRRDDAWQSDGPRQLALFDLPETSKHERAGTGHLATDHGSQAAPGAEIASLQAIDEKPTDERPARSGDLALAEAKGATIALRPLVTTLRAAIEEYKQYLAAMNRSKHTRESFALDLRLLLEHLGNAPLQNIGERELRSFISWVSVQRGNSATSVRRKVATLKSFFAYLHRERAIAMDPAATLIYPEIYPALPEFLEDQQVEDLLAAAEEHQFWNALVMLMLATGLKRDEVVALGRSDVVLAPTGGESYLVVRETEQAKRLRSRRLDLDGELVDVLAGYLAAQPVRERFFDVSARGVNFIVETCGRRAHIAAKANKLTPQILRSTFAVRAMRAMITAEDAQRMAGVSEITVAGVAEQHDLQLLRLLGLHEEPESAKKYRKLVRGWSAHTRQ